MNSGPPSAPSRLARLPIFYGWIIVVVAFITMAIGVNARTAFSLLFPPILDEYGWDRGVVAGFFSFGFFISAFISPFVGRLMDLRGPRLVVEIGVAMVASGLALAVLATEQWHFALTLGVLVGAGANLVGYGVHSQFIPNWFVRRRGLAIGIAFSGVGAGSIVLLPWLQAVIAQEGWRYACLLLAAITAIVLVPLNLLLRKRPQDIGLHPDGDAAAAPRSSSGHAGNVVDPAWASITWTLSRALRTARFWWIGLGYFCMLYAWYAVQVHQTKYLIEIGVSPMAAAWALGLVSLFGVPGQIVFGYLSDRIGREWTWGLGCAGFAVCYLALIVLPYYPTPLILYAMVIAQGFLGYATTPVLGPIVAEIFEGPHFGAIFGSVLFIAVAGGAAGPWVTGILYDLNGNYAAAFWLAFALSIVGAIAIWIAAPRKVRRVAGRIGK